jgi:hypothetical protein
MPFTRPVSSTNVRELSASSRGERTESSHLVVAGDAEPTGDGGADPEAGPHPATTKAVRKVARRSRSRRGAFLPNDTGTPVEAFVQSGEVPDRVVVDTDRDSLVLVRRLGLTVMKPSLTDVAVEGAWAR